MAHRENYYRVLDLDPDELDFSVIEKQIQKKQRDWSKQKLAGRPEVKRIAAANLENLNDIRRVLGNPESRVEEAKAAKRLVQQQRQEKLQQLDEQIALLAGDGSYTREDLKLIGNAFRGVLTQAEIEQRLKAAGLSEVKQKTQAKPTGLDPTVAKSIHINLDALGLDTLYQLLGLKPHSSTKALSAKADELYSELKRVGKTDAQASARSELLGHCKRVFADDGEKSKYDHSLAAQLLDAMKPNLELAGRDGYLSTAAQEQLVSQAVKRGAHPQLAQGYISEYASKRKWGLQRKEANAKATPIRLCGYCGTIVDPDRHGDNCSQCGEPLIESCPRCQAAVPTTSFTCPECGCHTGDGPLVRALMAEGREEAAAGHRQAARQVFDRVLAMWPDWQPACTELDQIQAAASAIEQQIKRIESLLDARRLGEARTQMDHAERRWGDSDFARLRQRLTRGLNAVAEHLSEGRKLRAAGDSDGAIEAFTQASTLQIDCTEAEQALLQSPPSTPKGLKLQAQGTGFTMSWRNASSDSGTEYLIVRKAGSRPNGPDDGDPFKRQSSSRFTDTNAPVGTAWYYAIYACRGTVISSDAAHAGPCLRTAEVEDLTLVPGDRSVTLSWKRPPGCTAVEVRRQRGTPPAAKTGVSLQISGDTCIDSGLSNEQPQGYRVIALFPEPSHPMRRLSTAGLTRTAVPSLPPEPVHDLRQQRNGRDLQLRWTPPAQGHVQIHCRADRPQARAGDLVDIQDADRIGKPIPVQKAGACRFTPSGGVNFLIPRTVRGDVAVVGTWVEATLLDPITAVKSQANSASITLTWTWPERIHQVRILYNYDRFPERPDDPKATAALCTDSDYSRKGCWQLHAAKDCPHYFTVYSAATVEGPYSSAVQCLETLGQEQTVRYQVVIKRWIPFLPWIREIGLRLISDRDLHLRNLVLVGKPRTLPMFPSDGMTLVDIPRLELDQGQAWIPIDQAHWDADLHVKLFFQDDHEAKRTRLQNARASAMRLG